MQIECDIKKKLKNFELDIRFKSDRKWIGILGESGSGKSMTLKCLAGIEYPDSGVVRIHGNTVYDGKGRVNVSPQKRGTGYLFQNYALFPKMTVSENILAVAKGKKEDRRNTLRQMLDSFNLNEIKDKYPFEISGGQQQKVALARIMASEPEVILLDEPFSALDMYQKDRLMRELKIMLADFEGAVILVSHSRDEIYAFCEELVIIEDGHVVCSGDVKTIFKNPLWKSAARLTGCKNIAKAEFGGKGNIYIPEWDVCLTGECIGSDKPEYVGYRAHDFIPVWGERKDNCIKTEVVYVTEQPFERLFFIKPAAEGADEICWAVQRARLEELEKRGMPDYLMIAEDKVLFLK